MGYCAVSGGNFFMGHCVAGVTNICVNVWRGW